MHDPSFVGRLRGAGQRLGQLGRPLGRHRRPPEQVGQPAAVDVLHREERPSVPLADLVDPARGWDDRAARRPRPRRAAGRGPGAARTHPPRSSSRPRAGPVLIARRGRRPPCRLVPARGSARTRGSSPAGLRSVGTARQGLHLGGPGRGASVFRSARGADSHCVSSSARWTSNRSRIGPASCGKRSEVFFEPGRLAELLAEHHLVIEEVEDLLVILEEPANPPVRNSSIRIGVPSPRRRRNSSWSRASAVRSARGGRRLRAAHRRLPSEPRPGGRAHSSGASSRSSCRAIRATARASRIRSASGVPPSSRRSRPSPGPRSDVRAARARRRQPAPRLLDEFACGQLATGTADRRRAVLDRGPPIEPPLIAAIGTFPPRVVCELVPARWSRAASGADPDSPGRTVPRPSARRMRRIPTGRCRPTR